MLFISTIISAPSIYHNDESLVWKRLRWVQKEREWRTAQNATRKNKSKNQPKKYSYSYHDRPFFLSNTQNIGVGDITNSQETVIGGSNSQEGSCTELVFSVRL